METVILETPKILMCAPCSQMSPFRAMSFVVRCVANLALSRTIASSSFHVTFVMLPPFVSPKTASHQPAIDPELFMDVFMDSVSAFSTPLRDNILRVRG